MKNFFFKWKLVQKLNKTNFLSLVHTQVFSKVLCNGRSAFISSRLRSLNESRLIKMNNNSDYYSTYSNPGNHSQYSQYYDDEQSAHYADLNNNLLANYDLNYDFNRQGNLSSLPVNYYYENYTTTNHGDFVTKPTLLANSSTSNPTRFNQSRRLFHLNSIISCSSMRDKHGTLNGGENNLTEPLQRPIDQIEELLANKTLFQADLSAALSTASPSICSNWNSSERNMITNSSSYDEQENYSLYNSTLSPNPSNQSGPHSLVKRSSLISSSNDTNLPKLKPIYRNGRFSNPFDTWKERTVFGTFKFLLSPANIGLPKNRRVSD